MENVTQAKKAWQKNREKRMRQIDGEEDKKFGRVKLKKSMTDWYDLYKRYEVKNGRPRSERTIKTDEDTMKQIFSKLGEKQLCDIDSDMIQKYMLSLVSDGVSQSTIKKRWNMLSMFFEHENPGGKNPMLRCKCPESEKKKVDLTADDIMIDSKSAYTDAQMKLLANELSRPFDLHCNGQHEEHGYAYGKLLVVVMYEFLRISESTELRVKDIDWEKNVIHIRRQYDELHKKVKPPKYGSRRDVPIMEECRDILKAACYGKEDDELLFTAGIFVSVKRLEHEGRILTNGLRNNLSRACKKLGLENHTPHDLRHDGISLCVRKGAKPQSIQRWAGHKSLSVTLDKYYRHTGTEDADDMAIVTGIEKDDANSGSAAT